MVADLVMSLTVPMLPQRHLTLIEQDALVNLGSRSGTRCRHCFDERSA